MPAPKIPTTREIADRIINDIETRIGQQTPLFAKAFNRVIATAGAGAFTILYKYGQWAIKQIFTITQDADNLELKGDQYDIPRKAATTAALTIEMTGDSGVTVPAGTEFRGDADGLVYATETQVDITAGDANVDVTCLTAGSEGNLTTGSGLTILQPITGLDNQATVTAIATEAGDKEDIDDYRSRIQEREKLPPQGGSLVDYIQWAKEVAGVTRAFAYGNRQEPSIPPGEIAVYPLTDNDPDGRIPSPTKLDEIHDYIDDPERAPLQVTLINVLALTELTFDINVTALSPNTSEVRNAFEANVTEYLLERGPQQFANQTGLKNVISRSAIEAIYINSGAQSVSLTVDLVGAGTIESYELAYNEVAKLGTITGP